jgi:hypothetical protein
MDTIWLEIFGGSVREKLFAKCMVIYEALARHDIIYDEWF